MKPTFSLELSHDGIKLSDLSGGAPTLLGEVALADPDFDSKVAELRNSAAEQCDLPMMTEVIIPESEILFTTFDHPDMPKGAARTTMAALRAAAVRDELDGMTPYPIEDLAFVWRLRNRGEIGIAAVARATLAEAEGFATSKGFNPIRFLARPEQPGFGAPINFGPTALIQARRAAEAQEAARMAAAAEVAAPDPAPQDTSADTAPGDDPILEPTPDAPARPEFETPSETDANAVAAEPSEGDGATAAEDPPEERSAEAKHHRRDVAGHPETERRLSAGAKHDAEDPAIATATPTTRVRRAPLNADAGKKQNGSALDIDDVPPAPVAFSTRRKPQVEAGEHAAVDTGIGGDTLGEGAESRLGRLAARFGAGSEGPSGLSDTDVPPPPPRGSRPGGAGGPAVNPAALARANGPVPPLGDDTATTRPFPRRPLNGAEPRVTPTDTPMAADRAAASLSDTEASNRPLRPRGKLNEADAMTVFGARAKGPRTSPLVPMLIGLVVAIVLAVGVWTAFFVFGNQDVVGTDEAAGVAEVARLADPVAPATAPTTGDLGSAPEATPPAALAPDTEIAALTAPPNDTETLGAFVPSAPAQDPAPGSLSPAAPDSPASAETPPASETAAPEPMAPDPLRRALARAPIDGDAVVARYATSGVWERAPRAPDAPTIDRIDDLYAAATDVAVTSVAAPDLPSIALPQAPPSPEPPGPAGEVFDLDERGLVRATPDGAVSPDGIVITAGPPPVLPPENPSRPAALAPAQPDLPATRPRDRPGDLVGQASDDDDQTQAEILPETRRLATLRPRIRPAEVLLAAAPAPAADAGTEDEAPSAQPQTEAPDLDPAAPVEVARAAAPPRPAPDRPETLSASASAKTPEDTTELARVSPYAIARSPAPPQRNARLAAAAQARFAAAPAPQPQSRQEPAATVTRVAAASAVTRPSIPSKASVASRATIKNAINLGRINLIGVYGSTSNRRALVRLPSGKFVKVKVGDRVDGGQISAIGQSNLSYTKRGRRVTLDIPSG